MNIAHIVGNRPQFIKLSLLHRALARHSGLRSRIIHTGQHFSDNMSAVFFRECQVPEPEQTLGIHSLSHNEMIGRMLIALDAVLVADRPDAVVVYGDTNTTLAGALAARKRDIPLLHVEAGVRTGRDEMPEESNRYLSDRLASLNFTCTQLGKENLLKEGFSAGRVYNTGDLMLDATRLFAPHAAESSRLPATLVAPGRPFVLATIHRAENTDDPAALAAILQALHDIHRQFPVVFPLHPRTRKAIEQYRLPFDLLATPPLGYLDMLALVQASEWVITDSGGLCREAFFLGKPSLVVMKTPFWPEILENGPNLSSPAEAGVLVRQFNALAGLQRPFRPEIFGDGHAAERMAHHLLNHLHV